MEGRREPEPALRGKIGLHLDIGDQEAFLEVAPLEIQPELAADPAVRAVTGKKIVTAKRIGAVRCLDLGGDACFVLADRQHPVLEAKVDQTRKVRTAFDQILLDVILLQVDEGRELVPVFRQQVEIIDLLIAAIDPAELPGDAFFEHAVADAETVENL